MRKCYSHCRHQNCVQLSLEWYQTQIYTKFPLQNNTQDGTLNFSVLTGKVVLFNYYI